MEISRPTNYTLTPDKCSHAPWRHHCQHIKASVLEAKETCGRTARVEEQVIECTEAKHTDRAESPSNRHLLSLVAVTAYTSPQCVI